MSTEDTPIGDLRPLLAALVAAQAAMPAALKSTTNPHLRSKYANLASVWSAMRAPLAAAGLCVSHQLVLESDDRMLLSTTLWHAASGGSLATLYPLAVPRGAGSQLLGAALTYARRYSLLLLVCAVTDDDDDDDGHATTPARAPERTHVGPRVAPVGSGWRADTADELRAAMAPPRPTVADPDRQAQAFADVRGTATPTGPERMAELGAIAARAAAAGDAAALERAYCDSCAIASSLAELDAIGAAAKAEPMFAQLPRRRPESVAAAYARRQRELQA